MRSPIADAAGVRVPFLDLGQQHQPIRDDVLCEIGEVIKSGAFTNGPAVAEFEEAFRDFCGAEHCVGVASGLDALRLGLEALGIERGDEVIVPAQTFVATLEAVSQAGGVPVPVEISEDDYCLDPGAVASTVGERTRFVMPVHLYGQLADMSAISGVARRHHLTVIEDACQAHGATRGDHAAGRGYTAAFSFYPGKNLGAFGDAGALTLSDGETAARVRALREHGQTAKYHHEFEGYTSRLDTIQAVALNAKLPLLATWNEQRRKIAERYAHDLEGVGDLRVPNVPVDSHPVWHLYVVRTADPTGLGEHLNASGIGSGRHYPFPPHLSPAYAHLGFREGSFPVAEALARECLSLPMFPGMSEAQIDRVVAVVRDFF